jgi:virginiamycin B lyase
VTIWFTGKTKNTVGKIAPDGKVTNYALPTAAALPIYVRPGPDGNMWVTELTGNKIARVTPDGQITEFAIPTANSRPIAIVPDPAGRGMWFSQEAGNNVGFITSSGQITEFAIPKPQANMILAGLSFDRDGNLWVQQYLNLNSPTPDGDDAVIRIDKSILGKTPAQMTAQDFTRYPTPSKFSVLHRIILGPDGNMWFTALKVDNVGRVTITKAAAGGG